MLDMCKENNIDHLGQFRQVFFSKLKTIKNYEKY